jgi:MFS family permease
MASRSVEKTSDDVSHRGWRFWAIFPALGVSAALTALDTTILSTALPTVVDALGADALSIWLLNAYTLPMTAVQPVYGQAANIFGRKPTILVAIALFCAGSGICAAAHTTAVMIAGRVVQGLGAGGVSVLPSMIIGDLVPLRQRPKFQGFVYVAFAVGTDLGPVVGGTMVERIGWRWVFWMNLPVSGAALLMIAAFLRVRHTRSGTMAERLGRIDWVGNGCLMASVTSILLALSWAGSTHPWSDYHILVPLFLGFVGIVFFVGYEGSRWCHEPTMPLHLFQNQTSSIAYIQTFLHGVLLYWVVYFLPVYFQAVLQASPQQSGLAILASMVPMVPCGIIGGLVIAKIGRYKINQVIGFGLMTISIGCFTLLDQHSSSAAWVGYQLIFSAGTGILMTAFLPAIQAPLPEADVAAATATWGFIQSFGYIWGAAIPSSIFNTRFSTFLPQIPDAAVRQRLSHGGAYEHASGAFISSLDGAVKSQVIDAYVASLKLIWQIGIAFAVLAFVASVLIHEVRLREELETEFGFVAKGDGPRGEKGGTTGRSEEGVTDAKERSTDTVG